MNYKGGFKMKKKFMIPMLAVLGLAMAFAGVYIVNSFSIQSDVYEPFTVSYAILGDAGNYDGTTLCSEVTEWTDYSTLNQPVDVDGLYAGESRKFCVKIDNAGEGDVPYVISSSVEEGLGNLQDCLVAFPEIEETGTAIGNSTVYGGAEFTVPADAPVVEDCIIQISVARGTLE